MKRKRAFGEIRAWQTQKGLGRVQDLLQTHRKTQHVRTADRHCGKEKQQMPARLKNALMSLAVAKSATAKVNRHEVALRDAQIVLVKMLFGKAYKHVQELKLAGGLGEGLVVASILFEWPEARIGLQMMVH